MFELVTAFTIEVFMELHKHRNEEVKKFQAADESCQRCPMPNSKRLLYFV